MAKSKPKSPFTGRWHIVSMSAWDDDYLDEEVQAFIEFDEKGSGSFQFGYVQGQIDYRTTEAGWQACGGILAGTAETAQMARRCTGRGWAVLEGDELNGMICIHRGDDSEFVAKRAKAKKRSRKG